MSNTNWANRFHVLKSLVFGQDKACPFCGSSNTKNIGSNATLSHVRECPECRLMFRWPKQDTSFNQTFYQKAYSKFHHSAVTDLPDAEQIGQYKSANFKGSPRDFSAYTELMKQLGVNTVLDYGCSWGYGVYQFQKGGLATEGLEISQPRAEFGRKFLEVKIHDNIEALEERGRIFDCIFSSHVLEHLPTPRVALDLFSKILKPGGWLILEVPNCGGRNAKTQGLNWGPFSSSIHPLSYSSEFFLHCFSNAQILRRHFCDKPLDSAKEIEYVFNRPFIGSPAGDELIVIVQLSP